jgi:DNA-binding NtrC family response regulator
MPGKSVLVVEDEESIRESLVELFEGGTTDIRAAATLEDARRILAERPIDFVITDLRLGTKRDGGLQVMAAAGLLAPDATVVVLTAYPDEANRHAAKRLGATHFLQKPVDLDVLARMAAVLGIATALIDPASSTG